MRKQLLGSIFILCMAMPVLAQRPVAPVDIVLQGDITADMTLTAENKYLLQGFVNVLAPATLTIEPGTVIYGDQQSLGTLIINRGAKIMAEGSPQKPIVFTSRFLPGHREPGDWGGVVIAGRASVNISGGEGPIEGTNTIYGGGSDPDDDDNSGVMRYVRIEFGGIEITPNNEINGLTMGGVGRGSTFEYLQVSYVDDDAFEWFGGTADARYLMSLGNVDDDLDGDLGWRGRVQHVLVVRDPDLADAASGGHSNAFEQDNAPNEETGATATPRSAPVFSNITVIGPIGQAEEYHPHYQNGMLLRTGTHASVYNSIVMGFPRGLRVNGASAWGFAQSGDLQVRNVILTGDFAAGGGTPEDTEAWFKTEAYTNQHLHSPDEVQLVNPFLHSLADLSAFDPRPLAGSPATAGASIGHTKLDDYFTETDYIGAFAVDGERWDLPWANYDPQNTDYTTQTTSREDVTPVHFRLAQNFPNPFNPSTTIEYGTERPAHVRLSVFDALGREVAVLVNRMTPPGYYSAGFDAAGLPSGMYLYRLEVDGQVLTRRMSLIK